MTELDCTLSFLSFLKFFLPSDWSQFSVVNIVTRLPARQSGVKIPEDARDLSLPHNVQTSCRAHPASNSLGTGDSVPRVKWLSHDGDHSAPSSTENEWSSNHATSICLHGIYYDNYTFTLYSPH